MTESSTATTIGASAESPIIRYAVPNDVYATLEGGGIISIEECTSDGFAQAAHAGRETGMLLLSLGSDPDSNPCSTVYFHPDQSERLAFIQQARAALDAAEAALEAVGYMDNAHLRTQDYRTPAQRERNAFGLGRDSAH